MDIDLFVDEFAKQFDEIPKDLFGPDTLFKENNEWSSMTMLCIIAMVDENYHIKLTDEDVKRSTTVRDIFNIVMEKTNS